MSQKIMAICDIEEGYAFRMAEYILEKVRRPIQRIFLQRPVNWRNLQGGRR